MTGSSVTTNDAPAPAPRRSGVRELIEAALLDYRLTNMRDDIGSGYPLVDLMSNDGTSIATGKAEIFQLADVIAASLASDASPRGEAVAWVPQSHLDFLAEGRANNRPSNALVHDRPNEEMGWTVPLYAHPAPASAPAEVEELVEAVKHLSAVSDGVWVQGVSDSEMALLSTAWKRVDAALAALASPATRSEEG